MAALARGYASIESGNATARGDNPNSVTVPIQFNVRIDDVK